MTKPLFVVLEGIDASGKSTQAVKLANALNARLLKFPDKNTPTGRLIYSHLAGEWHSGPQNVPALLTLAPGERTYAYVDEMVFQSLHFSNRLEAAPEIVSTLENGRSVVADRYLASAVAYGKAAGLHEDWLWRVQSFLPQPTLSILVDVPPEESFKRRPESRDRYEGDSFYLSRVATAYRAVWSSRRWPVVDGTAPAEEVHAEIMQLVTELKQR